MFGCIRLGSLFLTFPTRALTGQHAIASDGKGARRALISRGSEGSSPSLGEWTGMGGPNDITRGKDGNFYIAEQEDEGKPAYVCVRDANGAVLARMESRHVHGVGVDSKGDIYAGLTQDRSVDKFVRVG